MPMLSTAPGMYEAGSRSWMRTPARTAASREPSVERQSMNTTRAPTGR